MKTLFLLLFAILTVPVFAQYSNIDYETFMEDSQLSPGDQDAMRFVWWIPIEFWEMTLDNDPSISASEKKEFLDLLRPYTIIAAVDGKMGTFGGVTYKSEEELRLGMKLTGNDGKTYSPLLSSQLNSDVRTLISLFQPILKNIMGNLGENLHFFVFKDETDRGRAFDPHKNGAVSLEMAGEFYEWKTPFSSLMPKKKCPVDGEIMNGNWNYCPIHGSALKVAE